MCCQRAALVLPKCCLSDALVLPRCCLSARAAYVLSATYVPPNCYPRAMRRATSMIPKSNLPATKAVLPRCHLRAPSVQPKGYLSATYVLPRAAKVPPRCYQVLPKCYLRASYMLSKCYLCATGALPLALPDAIQGILKRYLLATHGLPCCSNAAEVLTGCNKSATYCCLCYVLPWSYLSTPYVLPAAIPKGHTLNRSNLAVSRRLWAPRRSGLAVRALIRMERLRRRLAGGRLLSVRVPSVQHQCYSSVPRNATECCQIRKCYHAQPKVFPMRCPMLRPPCASEVIPTATEVPPQC